MSVDVSMEDTDDGPAFSADDDDLTNRVLAGVQDTWVPEAWTAGEWYGVDITAIVSSTLARPGWSTGNRTSFLFFCCRLACLRLLPPEVMCRCD